MEDVNWPSLLARSPVSILETTGIRIYRWQFKTASLARPQNIASRTANPQDGTKKTTPCDVGAAALS